MPRQITITYPDPYDGLPDFMIEYSDDYGETFDTDGAKDLNEALKLIKEHEKDVEYETEKED